MHLENVKFSIKYTAQQLREIAKQNEGINVQSIAQDIVTEIPHAIKTESTYVHWAKTWLNYSKEQENELRKLFEDKGYKVATAYYPEHDNIFVLHIEWGDNYDD